MHRDAGKVAFAQQLVELGGPQRALDEDDHLVKLERVEKLVQPAVLLGLAELDVVLLQAVQRELRLVVDVDLKRVLHELLADRTDVLRQRGAEHHHLLLSRRRPEDLLHVAPHV